MRLTQLDIERPDATTMHVDFTPGLNVIDGSAADLALIGDALRSLFAGSLAFGRAFISVEDIEIEVTEEMAHLLPQSIVPPILDLATVRPESGPTLVSVRAALELLGRVRPTLALVDVDAALAATRDEYDMLEHRAERTLAAADDALEGARRRQQAVYDGTDGVFAQRRGWRHQRRLDDAEAARDHVDECVELATAAVRRARAELDDVRLRTGLDEHLRSLVAREYCLALRQSVERHGRDLTAADRDALGTAVSILRPVDDRRIAHDPLTDATAWLEHQEDRQIDHAVLASAARNCQPHPVLGVVPLIVAGSADRPLVGLERTVDALTSELQVIHLGRLGV